MRMLVVGAGSIGGLFGARLIQAGRDVSFLVRPARAEQIRQRGLDIVSPFGDATIHPAMLTTQDLHTTFDVILLSVKAYALDAAMEDLSPAVGSHSMILPVLNGMQHMDALTRRFGRAAVIGGACKAVTLLDEQGRIVQLNRIQEIVYGELDGTSSPRIAQLDGFMCNAGFDARATDSVMLEMWRKWALLATLGGVTCLMRGTTAEIDAAAGGKEFLTGFFDEVVAIIEAAGMPLGEEFVAANRQMLLGPSAPVTSSMYRDLSAGKPVEAYALLGDLLRRGREKAIQAPLVNAAYAQLRIYQRRQQDPAGAD